MRQEAVEPELAHPGEERRRTANSAATRNTGKEVRKGFQYDFKCKYGLIIILISKRYLCLKTCMYWFDTTSQNPYPCKYVVLHRININSMLSEIQ